MKKKIVIILLPFNLLFCALSCSTKQHESTKLSSNLYIDSLSFYYYNNKTTKPRLANSTSYAYNDSMSQVLDTLDLTLLEAMNSTDRSYDSPLSYKQRSDTIVVDIIYSMGGPGFCFGDVKAVHDSIFICLSGDVYRPLPKISDHFNVPYRFYNSKFRIVADTAMRYLIFFRDIEGFKAIH